MKRIELLFTFLIIVMGSNTYAQKDSAQNWPQFRGPFASGIMETDSLPDKWDVKTGKNIKWKIDIPGLGHSCPVIWEDKLFITTAISQSGNDSLKPGLYGDVDNLDDESVHEFRVMCIDKNSGKILWNQLANKSIPKTKRHTKASHADPTPATNGEYVVAFFGSNGLYCYSMDGTLVWKKDLKRMNAGYYRTPKMEWDVSSSPIIYQNTVIIQCDILGKGFLLALDIKTGDKKWRTVRRDVSTYSVPNVCVYKGEAQVVVNGYKHIGGYDFETGKEIWKLSGGGDIPVPTPVFAHGLIYVHSAHGKRSPIFAIRQDAKGNISLKDDESSNKSIVWSIKRGAAYIPSNIVYGDYYYNLVDWSGKIYCYNAKDGSLIYQDKLPEARGFTASAVAANGRIYYCEEKGNVFVIKAGGKLEIISKNPMNDIIMATPAISDGTLFFRTQHSLIAVGNDLD